MTGVFFSCDYLNEGKYAFLSIAIIIFPENIIQKTIYASALYFFIGILAKVFIEKFYYNILREFLKHWYNAPMVAHICCGCWCKLTSTGLTIVV